LPKWLETINHNSCKKLATKLEIINHITGLHNCRDDLKQSTI